MAIIAASDGRIDRIARKIRERGLRLGPTLSEHVITDFEARCGCALPDGYGEFLQKIGNGGVGPPSYGLLKLGEAPPGMSEQEMRGWSDLARASRPFPFTRPWVWEEGDPSDEGTREQVEDGSIHLGTDGCAQYWLLIVSGPERGNVWMLAGVGVTPTSPKRDFLQWFEDWLDGLRQWFSGRAYKQEHCMSIPDYTGLPDSMVAEEVAANFRELLDLLEHLGGNAPTSDAIAALYQLADRQWHTYELLPRELRARVAKWISEHWDASSLDFVVQSAFIGGALGLPEVLALLQRSLEQPLPHETRETIPALIKELEPRIHDPYSGMR